MLHRAVEVYRNLWRCMVFYAGLLIPMKVYGVLCRATLDNADL